MDLNYTAFFLISFVPLLIAIFWYHPALGLTSWAGMKGMEHPLKISPLKILIAFGLSFTIVYGYINLVIHQMGFYELFFTDIIRGNQDSVRVVEEFLGKYGQKHRHFGHGVFHGVINAFVFALPFIGLHALMEKKSFRYVLLHLSYWLVTSILIGGLISEFV